MHAAETIAQRCREVLPLSTARLSDEYYYQSLPLCVIDAVFSIGVSYESTRNTVIRYCDYMGLRRLRVNRESLPPRESQESLSLFLAREEFMGVERLTTEVFQNRQRTSTANGILKTEAVFRFARVLARHGVEYLQDLPKLLESNAAEQEILQIPGQGSGISYRYFLMVAGDDEFIKPDRMILRFLTDCLGRTATVLEAGLLLDEATDILRDDYPEMTPRLLDHVIWSYQRAQG